MSESKLADLRLSEGELDRIETALNDRLSKCEVVFKGEDLTRARAAGNEIVETRQLIRKIHGPLWEMRRKAASSL